MYGVGVGADAAVGDELVVSGESADAVLARIALEPSSMADSHPPVPAEQQTGGVNLSAPKDSVASTLASGRAAIAAKQPAEPFIGDHVSPDGSAYDGDARVFERAAEPLREQRVVVEDQEPLTAQEAID